MVMITIIDFTYLSAKMQIISTHKFQFIISYINNIYILMKLIHSGHLIILMATSLP